MNSDSLQNLTRPAGAGDVALQAVVVGGGIVGTCCALYLQREGFSVTLVDPAAPGDSTAKWSCGQISVGEVIPLSKPGILMKVPGWLMDQTGPLAMRPGALPGIIPWLLRFMACARQSRIATIAGSMATLTNHVFADYGTLLDACDDKDLIRQRPVMQVFDGPQGVEHERPLNELRRSLGFDSQVLSAAEIGDLEPALAGRFSYGILLPQWRFVSDTEGFIAALTDSFVKQGGRRICSNVTAINEDRGKATGVTLANGERIAAAHVVVAAGAGARRFFAPLGIDVPLEGVAGYQVLLRDPGVEFRNSVIYGDGGFCFTPMRRGLQIGGTIEFARRGAPPNFRRAEIILEKARRVLPQLNVQAHEFGVGYRPFLPDTKPIIDRSKRLPNVLMAIGHGQLGLTLGATTGRLIAEMAAGRASSADLSPFSAYRF
ncbi:NAD(P)/FAD-dependent oxidoreductase [Burkholderia multivorans]|uniref:Amino acid dehydrogenase n=1 Tax=Burkholderia multivorans TaxID=87883 RepID=A0AB37ASW0_9BURK|nr:FAD-dependent oxidoreductase [Burkholderia multivorans]PRE44697.1 amino acid dehydrogenase [Burkholderia multivorans]PRE46677.1 amino acid dehydrogenase [Burkholderia multivorans]